MTASLLVNLSDFYKKRVRVYMEHQHKMCWNISISDVDGIWLGDGKYIAEYNRGIEDCDASFSETDYRLIEEALGSIIKEEHIRNNSALTVE